jgi:hypothetical protein
MTHKRLTAYTTEDFDLLVKTIGRFQSIVVLPNTLTEVSNLSRHFPDPGKTLIAIKMQTFVRACAEKFVPSLTAISRPEFMKLGHTDAALLEFASIKTDGPAPTLLTADLDLAIAAEMKGYSVRNFNYCRNAAQ